MRFPEHLGFSVTPRRVASGASTARQDAGLGPHDLSFVLFFVVQDA